MMSLSPLVLSAATGLFDNTAFVVNTSLTSNISQYKKITPVSEFLEVLSKAASQVSTSTLQSLQTFSSGNYPSFTNTLPTAYVGAGGFFTAYSRFTDQLLTHANNILGNGDLKKFITHFVIASGYINQLNELVDSSASANNYLGPTFGDMDSLASGNITDVCKSTTEFGNDLINTGLLLDLDQLNTYGTPHALIVKLASRGLLTYLSSELVSAGVNVVGLTTKINELASNETLSPVIQKKCYESFKTVTGSKLETIKTSLKIKTTGINNLAELIDTKKIFPSSYSTLTSFTKDGLELIYINGGTNQQFNNLGKDYYSIFENHIADANVAMRQSLQQVKNIQNLTVIDFGNSVLQLNLPSAGLSTVSSLDKPISDNVKSFYDSTMANGSGDNGRYYLSDAIGTPAGITHTDAFITLIDTLNYLNSTGILDDYTRVLSTMIGVLDGDYGSSPTITIPGGLPGSGTYSTVDLAIQALISAASTELNNLPTQYSSYYATANQQFTVMCDHVVLELQTLTDAEIDMSTTTGNRQGIMGFAGNIHTYATQTEKQSAAEILEKICNTSASSGEAMIAALREGRNIKNLQSAGVGMDNIPPQAGNTQPGNISTGTS